MDFHDSGGGGFDKGRGNSGGVEKSSLFHGHIMYLHIPDNIIRLRHSMNRKMTRKSSKNYDF